jgi:glucose-1-phosphate adenylyltransferase
MPRPPQYRASARWYEGTADAMAHNLEVIRVEGPTHVLVLSGDHIYKMDYGRMLEQHIEAGADCTIGAVEIPAVESKRFGILEIDRQRRVRGFQEKPEQGGAEIPGRPGRCLGSMGIYIFEAKELERRLIADAELGSDSSKDFGKDILPRMVEDGANVQAHSFAAAGQDPGAGGTPYWRDVGTIEAFFEANLDLCNVTPAFNLYDRDWPIYTLWHNDPPAKTVFGEVDGRHAEVVDSLLCNGSIVSGSKVRRSILSNRVYTGEDAVIEECILMNGARIGPGARLKRVIVDKWVEVPAGAEIGFDRSADARRFTVSDSGIVILPAEYEFIA